MLMFLLLLMLMLLQAATKHGNIVTKSVQSRGKREVDDFKMHLPAKLELQKLVFRSPQNVENAFFIYLHRIAFVV